MRVLLNTNVLISYLLSPQRKSPVNRILEAAFLGQIDLLFPKEVLDGLRRKIPQKPYLAERISPQQLEELVVLLGEISESIPTITMEIPAVTRDPKDDYLIAYALVGRADYLVTGDLDLLILEKVEDVEIVTPRELWECMGSA
ncbi:MAG: putative toxin-antitoxin system toxin component, PIN family [Chloroflexota bacterium]|nr:putative toxin-antitoxin system toxin component, PIN family [Chloroflexota bacterium]